MESQIELDEKDEASAQAVINAYNFTPRPSPVDLRTAAQAYRNAIGNASTLVQLKSVLGNELMVLLKELAISRVRDL